MFESVLLARRESKTATFLAFGLLTCLLGTAFAASDTAHQHSTGHKHDTGHQHDADHHKGHGTAHYVRSHEDYRLPEVTLTSSDGTSVPLSQALNSGEAPLLVNFIFTSCPGICPVMTATFSQFQKQLGNDATTKVRMVSISIDPEFDTPEKLQGYAQAFDAGPQWAFYTGRLEDIIAVQKAFEVFRGNKMSHDPLTLLRANADAQWVRLEGFTKAADLMAEYRRLGTM